MTASLVCSTCQELSRGGGAASISEGSSLSTAPDDRWRVLYEISNLFNSPVYNFEEILEIILDMTIKITRADRGLLMLFDDDDQLRVRLAKNMNYGELAPEEREISKGVIEDVLKRESGVCIANVEQDSKFSELSSIINLKICAWIVTSRAVVGSSAMSNAGRQTSAIAIMARWRNPPDSSKG